MSSKSFYNRHQISRYICDFANWLIGKQGRRIYLSAYTYDRLLGGCPNPQTKARCAFVLKPPVGGYCAALPLCKFSRIALWLLS